MDYQKIPINPEALSQELDQTRVRLRHNLGREPTPGEVITGEPNTDYGLRQLELAPASPSEPEGIASLVEFAPAMDTIEFFDKDRKPIPK